jgi:hypothetical protein
MKRIYQLISPILLFLSGCELEQNTDVPILDEVRLALAETLYTPEGKLKSKFDFQEFHIPLGRMDYYYDASGQLKLSVGIKPNNDTASVFLFDYDQRGYQVAVNAYSKEEGKYILSSKTLKEYDEMGRIITEKNTGSVAKRTYLYDESGFLFTIIFAGDLTGGECHSFYTDDQKRTARMVWGNCIEGDTPIMEYFYRYNESGLLEAKETWDGLSGKKDAFQYFYNELDQMVEEKEFYPQWGFVPRNRSTYEYYTTS